MNHPDAIRLSACEKYLLGELAAPLRDEFEEHYFQCPECARDVQAASLFVAAGREALQQSPATSPVRDASPTGWFRWMRPAFALPAFAALLLGLGYENFVAVPHWRHLAAHATSSDLLRPVLLHPGISRGTQSAITLHPDQSFAVYLDIPTEPAYSSYRIRLQDPSGATRDLLTLSSADIQRPPLLKMPSDLTSGSYTVRVLGLSQPSASAASAPEVAAFPFAVEIRTNIEQH